MKAYIIKNKEGKYFTLSFKSNFTDDIRESAIFQEWEGADHDLDRNEFEDCDVVEITIAEGDLEKQLAEKDKEIKHLNKCLSKRGLSEVDFYKRLREKEDEIEKLNKKILNWQNGSRALKIKKETRHQICEEIREKLHLNSLLNQAYTQNTIDCLWVAMVLNQIEQGESDGTRNSKNV